MLVFLRTHFSTFQRHLNAHLLIFDPKTINFPYLAIEWRPQIWTVYLESNLEFIFVVHLIFWIHHAGPSPYYMIHMGNNYNLNIWESLKAPYFISRSPSGQRSISKLGLSKHSIDRVFGIFYCGQDNLWAESNFYRRNFRLETIF